MQITFGNSRYPFVPWKPSMGRVLEKHFAFDCETTLIDKVRPWVVPAYVLGAAFDGVNGCFITRENIAQFLQAHYDLLLVMHNAAFDLNVISTLVPELDIYRWVDRDRVRDTQLMHKLLSLGTEGHVAGGNGESTLEHCVQRYLRLELPKDTKDSHGNPIRLSYGQWLNQPRKRIEQVYLEYLAKDVIATRRLWCVLDHRLRKNFNSTTDTWGFVSPEWLEQQIKRWGLQTHHIQLKAAIALNQITANGLHLDRARHAQLVTALQEIRDQLRRELAEQGYLPGQPGCTNALQAILQRLKWDNHEVRLPRTETGQISTKHDALVEHADTVPFIKLLLDYKDVDKLLNSFLNKMGTGVLHPSFNVLARSGRTSSFGEINAQNLPTDNRVRSCFVPSPGHVFIDADYSTIEMATLSQVCIGQLGVDSQMGAAINAGKDLHTLVAAGVLNKPEDQVTREERKAAKPINFGKPGGMSNTTLRLYAKVNYGIDLTEQEVEQFSDAWFCLFPEMQDFLEKGDDLGLGIATLFGLTPTAHYEFTGNQRFVSQCFRQEYRDAPESILGWMCLKVASGTEILTNRGKPYAPADVDFFWRMLQEKIEVLPDRFHNAVRGRQGSAKLRRAIMSLVDRDGVFTFTGRLRARATYCARHNTTFQGLAADGMKLALWNLWRAGFRIVNEIHDQFLIEVPANSNLLEQARKIEAIMVDSMRLVVPDVRVAVTFAATDRWHKDAEAVYNDTGETLMLWKPT